MTAMTIGRTLDQDQPTRHSAANTDRQGVTALPDPHGAPAVVYRSLDCNPPEDQLIPPTDSEV